MPTKMATAIAQAQRSIKGAVQRVGGQLQTTAPSPGNLLTPQQQLDRFFNMTDADLTELRAAKGEGEFRRYTEAMVRLAHGGR